MDDLEKLRRLLDERPPPPEAREKALRELHAHYEAPSSRPSRPVARILTGVAAIVVVTVGALLTLQLGQAEAWAPIPVTPPDPSLVAAASSECGDDRTDFQSPLLVDQRDDVAVAMFGNRPEDGVESFMTCTLVLDEGDWRRVHGDNLAFRLLSVSGSFDEEVLGAGVSRVVIKTENRSVEVSHQDGFYLIWWPEEEALTGETMQFIAENGATLLEVPVLPSQDR